MPAGRITRYFKCESYHCAENPKWKNADHQAEVQNCPCCEIETEPYKIKCTGRLFGNFKCRGTKKSCGNHWNSSYAFCGRWQQCARCFQKVEPYHLIELNKKKGMSGPPKPHWQEFCQVCKDLRSQGIFHGCQGFFEEAELNLKQKKEEVPKVKNGYMQHNPKIMSLFGKKKKKPEIRPKNNEPSYHPQQHRGAGILDFEAFHKMNIRIHEEEKAKQESDEKAKQKVENKLTKKKKSKSKSTEEPSQNNVLKKIDKTEIVKEAEKDSKEKHPAAALEKKKSKKKKTKKKPVEENEKKKAEKIDLKFPFAKWRESNASVEKSKEKSAREKFVEDLALQMITLRIKNRLTIPTGAGDTN